MPIINTRGEIRLSTINNLLLQVACDPLKFVHLIPRPPGPQSDNTIVAADLAQQASASVVSNCVMEVWSTTVSCLLAVEPQFPLHPSNVIDFINESRMPFLAYVSLYFSICKEPFNKTELEKKMSLILKLRNEIEHDKPETFPTHTREKADDVMKWYKRLEQFLGRDALLWLPRVRATDPVPFSHSSASTVMRFMKYPIAKWVFETTEELQKRMREIMFSQKGHLKIVSEEENSLENIDKRFHSGKDPLFMRLWHAGE